MLFLPTTWHMHQCKQIRRLAVLAMVLPLSIQPLHAQDPPPAYALKGVTLHSSSGSSIPSATIIWRDGVIEASGSNIQIPFDAFVMDGGDSLHVYPGFLNGATTIGSVTPPRNPGKVADPGTPPPARAGIQPERLGRDHIEQESSQFRRAMESGFTTINLHPEGYMLPGQGDLMALHPHVGHAQLAKGPLGFHFQFRGAPGGWEQRAYPSTTMAVMARFRQLLYDASALKEHISISAAHPNVPLPSRDAVLESLFPLLDGSVPIFIHFDQPEDWNRYEVLRTEFGLRTIAVSDLSASKRASELAKAGVPVLISTQAPKRPDWMAQLEKDTTGTYGAEWSQEQRSFNERQRNAWQERVSAIKVLLDAGVRVGYADDSVTWKEFQEQLRTLVDHGGLNETQIVQLLSASTAQILGVSDRFGDLKPGQSASFSVFTAPLLEKGANVSHSVSNGIVIDWSTQREEGR